MTGGREIARRQKAFIEETDAAVKAKYPNGAVWVGSGMGRFLVDKAGLEKIIQEAHKKCLEIFRFPHAR